MASDGSPSYDPQKKKKKTSRKGKGENVKDTEVHVKVQVERLTACGHNALQQGDRSKALEYFKKALKTALKVRKVLSDLTLWMFYIFGFLGLYLPSCLCFIIYYCVLQFKKSSFIFFSSKKLKYNGLVLLISEQHMWRQVSPRKALIFCHKLRQVREVNV